MKTSSILDTYQTWLTHREYSPATIQKYTKALARFFADTGAGDIPTRETVAAWRDSLTEKGYTPATVNAMLAAVNDCQESIDNVAGKPLSRVTVWKLLKALCERANVAWKKVFLHNLRHLFARTFYNLEKNISKLADLLGHSSIETTRIYIMESGAEHERLLNKMHLLL